MHLRVSHYGAAMAWQAGSAKLAFTLSHRIMNSACLMLFCQKLDIRFIDL